MLPKKRPPAPAAEPRLRGRWLTPARGIWLTLALVLLVNFVVSIPAYYGILRTICPDPQACQFWQPTPDNVTALHRLGFSVDAYAVCFTLIDVGVSLVFWAVGLLIFWRKSDEWLGLFVSFVLIIYGSFGISDTLQTTFWVNQQDVPVLALLSFLSGLVQWVSLGLFLVTFPTGRFAPRWTVLIVFFWIVQFFAFYLGGVLGLSEETQGLLLLVTISLTYGSTAVMLIYRYLRVFTLVQRQQTKWVVFGVGTGVLVNTIANNLPLFFPELGAPDSPYQLLGGLGGLFTALIFLPIPLCTGIAILRYRLWDIEAIINKALVYGSLTALLGALYAGLIVALVSLAGLLNDAAAETPVALVIATLVIAALFQPARRRLQALIDQRFYRKKYDAAKTLAAFSATLRSEVDLDQLREQLLAVVQETMQPAHLSLWLRQPEQHAPEQPHRLDLREQVAPGAE